MCGALQQVKVALRLFQRQTSLPERSVGQGGLVLVLPLCGHEPLVCLLDGYLQLLARQCQTLEASLRTRFRTSELGGCLLKLQANLLRVYLRDKLSPLDAVAFINVNAGDAARNPALHLDVLHRLDLPGFDDGDLDVPTSHFVAGRSGRVPSHGTARSKQGSHNQA